jgi:hypothetical protein
MKTHRRRLLVLVPHRDARRRLQAWSGRLFSAGYCGAWSFPGVSPLAILSGPLSPAELKKIAIVIRERNGKITGGGPAQTAFPSEFRPARHTGTELSVFGPALDLDIPDTAFAEVKDRILYRFSPLVVGAAVVSGPEANIVEHHERDAAIPPELSFRAAALANMIFEALPSAPESSFIWKIDALHWLPPVKKPERDRQ